MPGKPRRPSAYTQAFTEQQKADPNQQTKETELQTETATKEQEKIVPTEKHNSINTENHKPASTETHKSTQTEENEGETHKTTIIIPKKLFQRVKIYVATHDKETLGSVQTKALEMFLDRMENQ